MKVGGNTPFADFLAKHGRGSVSSQSSPKEKYTSRAADQYKDELKRRSKEDELRYGSGPVTADGLAGASAILTLEDANGKANGGGKDDDFFDSWDKPSNILSPTPKVTAGPPRLGLGPSGTPNGSRPTTPSIPSQASSVPSPLPSPHFGNSRPTSPAAFPAVATSPPVLPPPVSRAVSSASLRTNASGGAAGRTAGSMKLNAGAKSKLGGVKKGGAAINFEEAERKAKDEEDRIKRLGYDREQEEKAAAAAAAASRANASSRSATPSTSTYAKGEMVGNHQKKTSIDTERLGMGFGRLGFGQVSGVGGEESAKQAAAAKKAATRAASGYTEPEETTAAREKFSSQKGISSDQYFGRNAYDPQAKAEATNRLQQFQGATAISSNQYFGREEGENSGRGNDLEESILGVESLSDLERTAKDAARRLMSQYGIEDFTDVQSAVRNGAMSVSNLYWGMYRLLTFTIPAIELLGRCRSKIWLRPLHLSFRSIFTAPAETQAACRLVKLLVFLVIDALEGGCWLGVVIGIWPFEEIALTIRQSCQLDL